MTRDLFASHNKKSLRLVTSTTNGTTLSPFGSVEGENPALIIRVNNPLVRLEFVVFGARVPDLGSN